MPDITLLELTAGDLPPLEADELANLLDVAVAVWSDEGWEGRGRWGMEETGKVVDLDTGEEVLTGPEPYVAFAAEFDPRVGVSLLLEVIELRRQLAELATKNVAG